MHRYKNLSSSVGQKQKNKKNKHALQLLKDIRDESLSSSLGTPHPLRFSRSAFLAELSRAWQYDNAKILVQWMTLVRAAEERALKTFLPTSFPHTAASFPSSVAAAVTAAAGPSWSRHFGLDRDLSDSLGGCMHEARRPRHVSKIWEGSLICLLSNGHRKLVGWYQD